MPPSPALPAHQPPLLWNILPRAADVKHMAHSTPRFAHFAYNRTVKRPTNWRGAARLPYALGSQSRIMACCSNSATLSAGLPRAGRAVGRVRMCPGAARARCASGSTTCWPQGPWQHARDLASHQHCFLNGAASPAPAWPDTTPHLRVPLTLAYACRSRRRFRSSRSGRCPP